MEPSVEVSDTEQLAKVILTPQVIEALRLIQDENNVYNVMMQNINEVIGYIANLELETSEQIEQLQRIKQLNFIRIYIQDLKKP